ncbi:hypothetical protein HN011_004964, partial [Eciton burchellii]
ECGCEWKESTTGRRRRYENYRSSRSAEDRRIYHKRRRAVQGDRWRSANRTRLAKISSCPTSARKRAFFGREARTIGCRT